LTSSQRAEILGQPAGERVAKIKEIVQEQEEVRRYAADLEVTFNWMLDIIKRIEPKLLDSLPANDRSPIEAIDNPKMRYIRLLHAAIGNRKLGGDSARHEKVLEITPADRESLVSKLSPRAQENYQKMTSDDDRRIMVLYMLNRAILRQYAPPSGRVRPTGDLRRFLDAEDPGFRKQLDYISPERMRAELENRFDPFRFTGRFPGGWGQGPRGPGPGGDRLEGRDEGGKPGPRKPADAPLPPAPPNKPRPDDASPRNDG
jgi:hypothetical protein